MLSALELPKSTWYYWGDEKESLEEKYASVRPLINDVIDEFPEYGRPRITQELQETHGLDINHKVVGKLLQKWDLAIHRAARDTSPSPVEEAIRRAGSDANLVKDRLENGPPIELFDVLYTDFTTLPYAGGNRSAKLMPMIGHDSKLIMGWTLGHQRNRNVACEAWADAKPTIRRLDGSIEDMIVHQDQDSVYTSDRWVDQLLLEDHVQLSYSTNGAKGNTYMESFNGHFKGPIESMISEAKTMKELREVIRKRVEEWNQDRRHSSLGQIAPRTYIENQQADS